MEANDNKTNTKAFEHWDHFHIRPHKNYQVNPAIQKIIGHLGSELKKIE